jgi:hypothetical protein
MKDRGLQKRDGSPTRLEDDIALTGIEVIRLVTVLEREGQEVKVHFPPKHICSASSKEIVDDSIKTAVQVVIPSSAEEAIEPGATVQPVPAIAAIQIVIADLAKQLIQAVATIQPVVSCSPADVVISPPPTITSLPLPPLATRVAVMLLKTRIESLPALLEMLITLNGWSNGFSEFVSTLLMSTSEFWPTSNTFQVSAS